ncbi:MAG: glycosyltransferase [Kiritimatiellae bacterium]|nr:glycosyltransferase [Kiritimatiellia bacterium]
MKNTSCNLVSVIIPCYRQAQYLPEAIDSALAQKDVEVEVIVVNDGSDDNTEAVARAYGNRIKYIWRENGGLAAARNTGFAACSGDFIQFLDADDIICPTKFSHQLAVFAAEPEVDVCYTNYRKVDLVTGNEISGLPGLRLSDKVLEDFLFRWEDEVSIPIHAALFRRRIWANRPPFVAGLPAREDWVMWVDLALRTVRFRYLEDVIGAIYRVHAGAMCSDSLLLHTSVVQASKVILGMIPGKYRVPFEIHAWHLADKWLRVAAFPSVPDYKRMYERAQARLEQIQSSVFWRIASSLRRFLGGVLPVQVGRAGRGRSKAPAA